MSSNNALRDAEAESSSNLPLSSVELSERPRKGSGAGLDRFKKAAGDVMAILKVARGFRHSTFRYADEDGKISLKKKLIYASPSFSLLSLTMLITIHGIVFYETIGTDLALLAFFVALARSFDVMTDPLMGWWSDSTRHPMGRRRPYMLYGNFGYALCFVAFMTPPTGLSRRGNAYWFGVWNICFYLFDTIANVPYQALGPELTDDPKERESVFFWRGLFDKVGVLAGAAGPAIVQGAGAGDRTTYTVLALIFGSYYVLTMLGVVAGIKEREKSMQTAPVPLVPSILRAFKNVAFRPLLAAWILDFLALGMVTSMVPFFVKYVIVDDPNDPDKSETVLGICLAALFVAAGLAMPVWKWLSLKFGKRRIWLTYNLYNALSNFFFIFLGQGDETWLYILAVINGVPVGGQFLIEAILSDVIDYDEFLNGTRSEGSFTVFATFIPKIISIPASAIPLAILSALGFNETIDGKPQEQSDQTRRAITVMFCIIPSIATLVSFFIKLGFPIKDESMVNQISEGIVKHEAGLPAYDPVTGADKVDVLRLDDEERENAWLLDNFSWKVLEAYADGRPTALRRQMKVLLVFGIIMFMGFVALVIGTFQFLTEDAVAWIPSFGCILAGMSLCFTGVTILRLRAANVLEDLPIQQDLARKIITHKMRGQRGGDAELSLFSPQGGAQPANYGI